MNDHNEKRYHDDDLTRRQHGTTDDPLADQPLHRTIGVDRTDHRFTSERRTHSEIIEFDSTSLEMFKGDHVYLVTPRIVEVCLNLKQYRIRLRGGE